MEPGPEARIQCLSYHSFFRQQKMRLAGRHNLHYLGMGIRMNRTLLLFIVIIIEGYVVLSTELLAIRQTLPYVGNGTDTVSIIIAAVLMPLAVGYYRGGRFKPGMTNGRYLSVRDKLINNILIAGIILVPALSYLPLSLFFYGLSHIGVNHRILTTTIYSLLFIVTPVYCLGQTIPLVSNYFSSEKLSQITGKMLFFSTLGSFLGAVFSTLVLMSFFGVHNTVCVVFALLTLLIFIISRKKAPEKPLLMLTLALVVCYMNSPAMMRNLHIVGDNQYDTVIITKDESGAKHFIQNGNLSSMLTPDGRKHAYIEFVERHYISPIRTQGPAKSILIIGAGGFTLGLEDTKNDYTYVDIDPSLKDISEKYFIEQKLGKNKRFIAEDVRAYLNHAGKKFDLIMMDAYFGDTTIPEYLVTREFFQQVKNSLNENGIVAGNFILSPTFKDRLSQNLDNTLHSVFPHLDRQVIEDEKNHFNGWEQNKNIRHNIIYSYFNVPGDSVHTIYTDDKNAVFFDKPKKRR
jgi:spermidine synthase